VKWDKVDGHRSKLSANRNCYGLLRVSQALAQISCVINSKMTNDVSTCLAAGVFDSGWRSDSGRDQSVSGWTWDGGRQQTAGTVPTCAYMSAHNHTFLLCKLLYLRHIQCSLSTAQYSFDVTSCKLDFVSVLAILYTRKAEQIGNWFRKLLCLQLFIAAVSVRKLGLSRLLGEFL